MNTFIFTIIRCNGDEVGKINRQTNTKLRAISNSALAELVNVDSKSRCNNCWSRSNLLEWNPLLCGLATNHSVQL